MQGSPRAVRGSASGTVSLLLLSTGKWWRGAHVPRIRRAGQGDGVAIGIGHDCEACAPEGVVGRLLSRGSGRDQFAIETVDVAAVRQLKS